MSTPLIQASLRQKSLISREKIWFPAIDRIVEDKVENCFYCQAATPGKHTRPQPLQMSDLPGSPWKNVAVDFIGRFPSGDYVAVVIDEYSRFLEAEIVTSASAQSLISKLDAIFVRPGIPKVRHLPWFPPSPYNPLLTQSQWRG